MAQTPAQKRANAKFAKSEEKRMGKPESAIKKKEKVKPPISTTWIVLLGFVLCGSLVFELLRVFPLAWDFVTSFPRQVLAAFK